MQIPLSRTDELSVDQLLTGQLSHTDSLVSLNFKVPLQLRLKFKVYAAQHNMTMTELLLQLFEDRLVSPRNTAISHT